MSIVAKLLIFASRFANVKSRMLSRAHSTLIEREKHMDRSLPLQEIQRMFRRIFHARNKRLYTDAEVLLHIFEEISVVAEALRKEDDGEIGVAVARLFGWLMAYLNMLGIDLARTVFRKYQDLCPYCGQKRNCVCISVETKPKKWHRNKGSQMPRTIDEWQQMFDRIYGHVNKVAGREKCWLHVVEELGEISRAGRLGLRRELLGEIADVFAWLVAFCNRARINISQTIIPVYPCRCDVCMEERCRCPKV